jgi:dihydrofolate reductase
MRRVVLFMHTSLDGFVAGPEREMDWIKVEEEMFDFALRQTNQSDTAIYGRITYELMDSYWPTAADNPNATKHDKEHSAWYNNVNKIIISKTMKDVKLPRTVVISEKVPSEIQKLKNQTGQDIVIFGSPSIGHLLMAENLIDDYWLFVNPILLGKGIPLFKQIDGRIKLKLSKSQIFSSGVVCLHYESIKQS